MYVRLLICPQCKSENIDLYMGFQFGKYQCKDCGYIGPSVIEKHQKAKKKPVRLGIPYWLSFILYNPIRKFFTPRKDIIKNSHIKKGSIVLEIGCGPGFFTETISSVIGEKVGSML